MKRKVLLPFALFVVALVVYLSCTRPPEIYSPSYGDGYYILTPSVDDEPRFNGANIFGVRPSSPFLFSLAVTGARPMTFGAENLPEGLKIDSSSGQITGVIADTEHATYDVKLWAKNKHGRATRSFSIVVGEDIALTPPMGWSSWIAYKKSVNQDIVLANAKKVKELGLDQYGYTYVNIDDAWQGARGGKYHAIQPSAKFPNIKELSDQIHDMGLKFGIYSTPWISAYAGFIGGSSHFEDGRWDESMLLSAANLGVEGKASRMGTYKFDENDARQWADWGVDYMKYDWNPIDSASIVRMATALRGCGRDIVFSISNSCPISVSELASEHVQVIRSNGDIRARWSADREHINLCDNWEHHNRWLDEGFAGAPGHTPDPDFLMIGLQGYGSDDPLTVDEIYHHVSSFVLWGGPMLLSCDLSQLTPFELSLVTNVEMLDVNQDRLSTPGRLIYTDNGIEVLVKELHNGDKAIGIFNFNDTLTMSKLSWEDLGLSGKQNIRDIWRCEDIGAYDGSFSAEVRPHGVVVVRASAK